MRWFTISYGPFKRCIDTIEATMLMHDNLKANKGMVKIKSRVDINRSKYNGDIFKIYGSSTFNNS